MQVDVDKNNQRVQDLRADALRTVVDDIKKQTNLQQLEVQSLRETILKQRSP
jgi:hypothetical protein